MYSLRKLIFPVQSGSHQGRVYLPGHLAPDQVSQPPEVPRADRGYCMPFTWSIFPWMKPRVRQTLWRILVKCLSHR